MADSEQRLLQLETHIANMQETLSGFTKLIKHQNAKIASLTEKLDSIPQADPEQLLLDRYTVSSRRNRNLNEKPQLIAYAAYLYYIRQVPASKIAECGILSTSKMQGLTGWEDQHLLDFCTLNNVSEVYERGVDIDVAKAMTPDYALLQDYLARKK